MNLIIVESPAKARTIKGFLGKDFEVIASKGHIRDLPKHTLGIGIKDQRFTPKYEVSKDHSDIVKAIKSAAKKAKKIYIATDEDREGEAIGYHIAKIIDEEGDQTQPNFPRIAFHEITKSAIVSALEHPRKINMNMVNAQQTRRLLDRIVGFRLSPLLSQKIQRGLSAGRVQSSALKLIVDREREIRAFVPLDYFSLDAVFGEEGAAFDAQLAEFGKKKLEKLSITNKADAEAMRDYILGAKFSVQNIEKKSKKVAPPPPFMTSTLQQAASSAFGYSPTKTMQIAQRLYEGLSHDKGTSGLITYMRTDSLNIAKVAQEAARAVLAREFGESFVPPKPRIYASKAKNAQEAHEAIRPTRLDFTPQIAANYLKSDELKLYGLIYNRFLASQSTDAVFESLSVAIAENGAQSAVFKANGSKLIFEGFHKILGTKDKDSLLPPLEMGESLRLKSCQATAHQTEPPSRYSESSLIKTLENLGIGRPSTYAPTIALLTSRDYINVEKKQLVPSEISFVVIEVLERHFLEIVDSAFTAKLEEKLDSIAEDSLDWQGVLWEFYERFDADVSAGKQNIENKKPAPTKTGESCPKCGAELVLRSGKFGEFVACSGYPKCKFVKKDESAQESLGKCEVCGKDLVKKRGKFGEFVACSGYPECKNIIKTQKTPPETIAAKCPECGGALVKRFSRRGAFFGCANYPKCKFITSNEPSLEKCESCGGALVKKETKTKKYLQCLKCKHKQDSREDSGESKDSNAVAAPKDSPDSPK